MTESGPPGNVILLTVDALRADHLSCYGYERETSPFLDDLAAESRWYKSCYAASSHTREAVPAMLTGQYPDVFAANGYRLVERSVADELKDAGFTTGAFHSNPYISRAYGFDRGFDVFDDDLTLGRHRWIALAQRVLNKFLLKRGRYHVRADELSRRALDWLDTADRPVFLWAHYMDPHGPYSPPDGSRWADTDLTDGEAQALYQKAVKRPDEISTKERRLLIDLYDGEIRYLDEQLRLMFGRLRDRGLLEESLVIVTADHGEAFGEHGYYGHPRKVDSGLLHVPLFVQLPGDGGGIISDVTSTLDVAPTALEWTGLDPGGRPGSSLLSSRSRDVVFSSVQGEGDENHVRKFAAWEKSTVIRLERTVEGQTRGLRAADRRDGTPLDPERDHIEELAERLDAHIAESTLAIDDDPDGGVEESDEMLDRLKTLGYR